MLYPFLHGSHKAFQYHERNIPTGEDVIHQVGKRRRDHIKRVLQVLSCKTMDILGYTIFQRFYDPGNFLASDNCGFLGSGHFPATSLHHQHINLDPSEVVCINFIVRRWGRQGLAMGCEASCYVSPSYTRTCVTVLGRVRCLFISLWNILTLMSFADILSVRPSCFCWYSVMHPSHRFPCFLLLLQESIITTWAASTLPSVVCCFTALHSCCNSLIPDCESLPRPPSTLVRERTHISASRADTGGSNGAARRDTCKLLYRDWYHTYPI